MYHNGVQNNSNTLYLTGEWQKDEEREKSLSRATFTVQSNSELLRVFLLLLWKLRFHCQPSITTFHFNLKGKIYICTFLYPTFQWGHYNVPTVYFSMHFVNENIKQFYPGKQHTLEDLIYFHLQLRTTEGPWLLFITAQ